jgi:hypothetical protein
MAKSHYNGDSPSPSPFSEHPGMSGGPETFPVKPAPFPALSAIAAPSMPMPYILNGGTAMYIGESMDCSRRLRDHIAADATPRQSEPFSTTSSID